jgi:hypothetical protein
MKLTRDVRMLRNAGEFFGDVLRLENEIHASRRHRAPRHRIVSGRFILRERNPALSFDGLQSQRAIGRRAGKDHADGPLPLVLGQRFKKEIDGTRRRAGLLARLKFQNALCHAQVGVGRNDIDVIGLHRQIVRDLAHRHRRGPRQNLREGAFMLRVEMLHQHKPQARVEWQMLEQLPERLQPAGRSADANDGKVVWSPAFGLALAARFWRLPSRYRTWRS